MKKKAIVEIVVDPDDDIMCGWECEEEPHPWNIYCKLFKKERLVSKINYTKEHLGYLKIFRLPECLAATKLAERIINELNRLRDLAGEDEHKSIGELLVELEVSDGV